MTTAIYATLAMVSIQVVLGMFLLMKILGILKQASGLLDLTSSHARLTDQTARSAAKAVNELREDVKVATVAAKEVATVAAEKSHQNVQEVVSRVLTGLDSFRAQG